MNSVQEWPRDFPLLIAYRQPLPTFPTRHGPEGFASIELTSRGTFEDNDGLPWLLQLRPITTFAGHKEALGEAKQFNLTATRPCILSTFC